MSEGFRFNRPRLSNPVFGMSASELRAALESKWALGNGTRYHICCLTNGAVAWWGTRQPVPANENARACQSACRNRSTTGCARYVYLDEQRAVAAGTGRCVFCAACTGSNDGSTAVRARSSSSRVLPSATGARALPALNVPALIISGCEKRYVRAAAVARAAGLSPRWLPGVFPSSKPLPACWLSKAQQGASSYWLAAMPMLQYTRPCLTHPVFARQHARAQEGVARGD